MEQVTTPVMEFADFLPRNLEPYAPISLYHLNTEIDDYIYSNEKIVNEVLTWSKHSKQTRPIYKTIEKGLLNKRIVVGFIKNRGMLPHLVKSIKEWWNRDKIREGWRMKGYGSIGDLEGIFGMYSYDDKRLFVILDDNVSFLGKALRDLPPILIHELCHFASHNDNRGFIRGNMDSILYPFYNYIVFQVEPKSKNLNSMELQNTIKTLSENFELMRNYSTSTESQAFAIWTNFFKKCSNDPEHMALYMLSPYIRFFLNALKPEYHKIASRMSSLFYSAYDDIKTPYVREISVVGQEAIFPSEVVCIANQVQIRSQDIRLINSIPMEV